MIDRLQLTASRRAGVVAVVLAAALLFAVRGELAAWVAGNDGAESSIPPITFYTCSMDPSVESDHPGTCPICGMALTPVTQQERSAGIVRVASRARALISLDVAPVQKSTLRKRIVASGEVVEPAPAADRAAIAARVYRGDASDARGGQSATVTVRDIPLMQLTGTIVELAAGAPAALRIEVDNPEHLLRPGMVVEVQVEVELPPRLAVPSSAVLYAGKRRLVFVERSRGIFEPRTPELGMSSDGLVEVVGGLSEGEQVAVSGTFLLGAESRIRSDGTLWGGRPEPATIKPSPPSPPPPRNDTSPSTGW